MTYPEALVALETLYATLPTVACKGRCTTSCGPLALSHLELQRIRRQTTLPTCGVVTSQCPLLRQGRCSVYGVRPLICRAYGVTESMECPHGCVPERWLSPHEWATLVQAVESLSQSLFPTQGTRTMHAPEAVRAAQEQAAATTAHCMWMERLP